MCRYELPWEHSSLNTQHISLVPTILCIKQERVVSSWFCVRGNSQYLLYSYSKILFAHDKSPCQISNMEKKSIRELLCECLKISHKLLPAYRASFLLVFTVLSSTLLCFYCACRTFLYVVQFLICFVSSYFKNP